MTEPKFTPGPWVAVKKLGLSGVIKGGVIREYVNGSAQDQLVMVCSVADYNGGFEATEANAHLIAAAPELYEALEEFVCTASKPIVDSGKYHEAWVKARAALAKARGESHD